MKTLSYNCDDWPHPQQAYTLAEVFVAIVALGIMMISLFAGYSSGFLIVQMSRENLRATQIMVQKMESIRILNWYEVTNSAYLKRTFTDYYNPSGTNAGNGGTVYSGTIELDAPSGPGVITALTNNMRSVTVTLYWTNYPHRSTNGILRWKQMQSLVARYGMQNYVYQ